MPVAETKNERWRRVVTLRAGKAIQRLRQLQMTAKRSSGYMYSREEAEALVAQLQAEVDAVREAYFPSEKGLPLFQLPEQKTPGAS